MTQMSRWIRSTRSVLGINRPKSHNTRAALRLENLEDRTVPTAIVAPPIYQNPFMAPNNFSEIHLNSQQTDTFSVPGPASAPAQSVQQGLLQPSLAIGGTVAFDSAGQIVSIRTGLTVQNGQAVEGSQTLLLIDPVTLKVISSTDLPPRPPSNGTVSFAGGGYFYMDNQNRVVCITSTQEIRIYTIQNNQFSLAQSYDLSAIIDNPNDILNSVLPDSSGNLWFITDRGDIGNVQPSTGSMELLNIALLPGSNPAETNTKSFASDGQGGVYVVTDYALYRFQATAFGVIHEIWRSPYDRGTRIKSGQNQQGSGTTPTVFDDFAGNQFVAIADNADPYMHIDVFNRNTGALVAAQAVFSPFPFINSCENSLIAINHSVFIENNFGNSSVGSTAGSGTTIPGVARVDFNPTTGASLVVWENDTVAIPSIVSQLSTGDARFYGYAKNATGWYWVALDFATGLIVASTPVLLSSVNGGTLANNYYSGLTVGPDGSAYAGVFGGYVAWRPLATQNAIYVNTVYTDLLARPADASGLNYFSSLLNQGFSRSLFVLTIENTTEFHIGAVNHQYFQFLGRAADPSGMASSLQLLAAGGTIELNAARIIGSQEYYQLHGGTNLGFLTGLYADVLHRAVDPVALMAYSQELAVGVSRFQVAYTVVTSTEGEANTVQEVYQEFLNRVSDPSGLAFWVNQILNGARLENVIAGLVGSDEFFANDL